MFASSCEKLDLRVLVRLIALLTSEQLISCTLNPQPKGAIKSIMAQQPLMTKTPKQGVMIMATMRNTTGLTPQSQPWLWYTSSSSTIPSMRLRSCSAGVSVACDELLLPANASLEALVESASCVPPLAFDSTAARSSFNFFTFSIDVMAARSSLAIWRRSCTELVEDSCTCTVSDAWATVSDAWASTPASMLSRVRGLGRLNAKKPAQKAAGRHRQNLRALALAHGCMRTIAWQQAFASPSDDKERKKDKRSVAQSKHQSNDARRPSNTEGRRRKMNWETRIEG